MTNQSEGRKPKLTWEESRTGYRPVGEDHGLIVITYMDGTFGAWAQDGRISCTSSLEDAQLACEDWLKDQIRPYLPAARALGLLEPSEEEIADAARALKENGVNLSTMDRSALERRVLELYARFRKEEQST